MDERAIVTFAALLAGVICFLLYVRGTLIAIHARPAGGAAGIVSEAKGVPGANQASLEQYVKLLEAASKLTDSLGKAGPSLISLAGAILFFSIAAVSSGALT